MSLSVPSCSSSASDRNHHFCCERIVQRNSVRSFPGTPGIPVSCNASLLRIRIFRWRIGDLLLETPRTSLVVDDDFCMPRYNPWAVPNQLVSREVIETWSISKSDRAKTNKTYTSLSTRDDQRFSANTRDDRWWSAPVVVSWWIHWWSCSCNPSQLVIPWSHDCMIFHLLCRRLVIVYNLSTGNGIKRVRLESDAKTPTKGKAVYWSWLTNSQQALRNRL